MGTPRALFDQTTIDRAIEVTERRLRQVDSETETLPTTILRFLRRAADVSEHLQVPVGLIGGRGTTYDQYLEICRSLYKACDTMQKGTIKVIILWMESEHRRATAEIERGNTEDWWIGLQPLTPDTEQGKIMLALAEAFGVKLGQ